MNAHLVGFAAALANYPVWVMNVVPTEVNLKMLGVIYERGSIRTYQNWCEAMSTYPRPMISFMLTQSLASTRTDVKRKTSYWKWIEYYDHKLVLLSEVMLMFW
ncbi:hypothetical protein ACH5RR_000238 [Cinchona calisaya]|uniref:Methyltransferase n=1 Tax=Cinchona calisaya TaxID=153742 RepID=A0ABD3B021_9GENT